MVVRRLVCRRSCGVVRRWYQPHSAVATTVSSCTIPTPQQRLLSPSYIPPRHHHHQQQQKHLRSYVSSCRRLDATTKPPQPPPPSLMLFNSLTNQLDPVHLSLSLPSANTNTLNDGTSPSSSIKGIACYTCGPTVYAPAHLGHARTYVWLDILRRVLEHQHTTHHHCSHSAPSSSSSSSHTPSPPPLFVLNITDVDDKILNEATARQKSCNDRTITPQQISRQYENEFWQDWDALNCLRPHIVTRVTEYVESDIVPYIQQLIDNGMAYVVSGANTTTITNATADHHDGGGDNIDEYGGVYFDVRAYEEKMGTVTRYGKLAPPVQSTDLYHRSSPSAASSLLGTPTDVSDASQEFTSHSSRSKRDERDFALWKKRKVHEVMYWESPWGLGRPGWHIECSAMIQAIAQQFHDTHTFTIHAGGMDLKFPHHTNEIAQAEAYHYNCNHHHHGTGNINNDEDTTNNNSNSGAVGDSCSRPQQFNEWIQHWLHTGHLHIDGMKMSKSLKNFISIKEFLSRSEDTSSDQGIGLVQPSRADDFRLWCLGLSGSYRGLATFSDERMEEARNVRNKILRFLLAGEEWLVRRREQQDTSVSSETTMSTKKWRQEDYEFFTTVNSAVAKSRMAILSDLDGSTYLEQMILISDIGRIYVEESTTRQNVTTEPMMFALQALRDLLALVGFSDATCQAGILSSERMRYAAGSPTSDATTSSMRAVLNELTRFRSAVRRTAIEDHKNKETMPSDNMRKILKLCDEARDEIFPALGVEFVDAGVVAGDGTKPFVDDWKFCIPRKQVSKTAAVAMNSTIRRAIKSGNLRTIPSKDLFKVGPYEGLFSEYNEDGFPLRTADGAEISNSQNKKLRKTFVRHVTQQERRRIKMEKRSKKTARQKKAREFEAEVDKLVADKLATAQLAPQVDLRPDTNSNGQ